MSFKDLVKPNPYAEYLTKEFYNTEFYEENFKYQIFNENKYIKNQEAYEFFTLIHKNLFLFL